MSGPKGSALGGGLAAELGSFAAELGERLVPPGCVPPMDGAAQIFAGVQPEFAFEVHIGAAVPRVDLTVRVKRRQRDKLGPLAGLPAYARRFSSQWSDAASAIAAVPFVEFEFDLPDHATTPWIGPAVEPSLRQGPGAVQRERDLRAERGEPAPTLALDALEQLGDEPLTDATRSRLAQALECLPRWGLIGQVARLDGRPSAPREGIRAFCSMPRSELCRYLARLEWRGSWPSLDRRIEQLSPCATWVDLDFGIHQGQVEPKIGYYLEFRGPRPQNSTLRTALDRLSAQLPHAQAAVVSLRGWVARVEGRQDRVLTIKYLVHGETERPPKVYFSALRATAQR